MEPIALEPTTSCMPWEGWKPAPIGPDVSQYSHHRTNALGKGLWMRYELTDEQFDRIESMFCIDGTHVRAARCAAGASEKVLTRRNPLTTAWAGPVVALARSFT